MRAYLRSALGVWVALLGGALAVAQDKSLAVPESVPISVPCVVVSTPAEREDALLAISVAEQGDRDGLLSLAKARGWHIESMPREITIILLPGAKHLAGGRARLEAELLEMLLQNNGSLDLSNNEAARSLVAEWVNTVLYPGSHYNAAARASLSNILEVPFEDALQQGLVRVDLVGKVWLTYDIPGVEGNPQKAADVVSYPQSSGRPTNPSPTTKPRPPRDKSRPEEISFLFSSGIASDQHNEVMKAVSETFKKQAQEAEKAYAKWLARAREELGKQWIGPRLDQWLAYNSLPRDAQEKAFELLASMKHLFEAVEQPFPQTGLPSGTRVMYEMIPTAYLTFELNGWRVTMSLGMWGGQLGSPDEERNVSFVVSKLR
ncbi:MAG: hypothetical protein WHT28_00400 [Fimbriimonadales bacterium]|jgi:hypothetical protein